MSATFCCVLTAVCRTPDPALWKGHGGEKVRNMIAARFRNGPGHRHAPEPGMWGGSSSSGSSSLNAGSRHSSSMAAVIPSLVRSPR
eukprot:scaffold4633_cov114-Isochrysis_galbana.AAC.3